MNPSLLAEQLDYLKLPFLKAQYDDLAQQAARQPWTHAEYLARLIDGQYQQRRERAVALHVKAARFPVIKTLEQFQWDWLKKINRLQVQNLFRLQFLEQNANAINVINQLSAAQKSSRLKSELRKYLRPRLLILDEIGCLPIDQHGADLLFQVISQRYERGAIVLTTNKPFKQWASIFNNDATLASAVLDRLLHQLGRKTGGRGCRLFAFRPSAQPDFQTGGFHPRSRRR